MNIALSLQVLGLVVLALAAGTAPAEAGIDAPCGIYYDGYMWSVLGLPVPVVGAGWQCEAINIVRFGDVENPP